MNLIQKSKLTAYLDVIIILTLYEVLAYTYVVLIHPSIASARKRKRSAGHLHDDQELEETVQEKRLRLAKDYLTTLEEEG